MSQILFGGEDMSGAAVELTGLTPSSLVSNFMSGLATSSNIPTSQMVLWFNNQILDPTQTLTSYSIQSGDNVTVIVAPAITSVTRGQDSLVVAWSAPVGPTTNPPVTYALGDINQYPFGTNDDEYVATASSSTGNLSCTVTTVGQNQCTITNVPSTTAYSVVVTAVTPGTLPDPSSPAVESAATTPTATTPVTATVPQPTLASTGSDLTPYVMAGPGLILFGAALLYSLKKLRRLATQ